MWCALKAGVAIVSARARSARLGARSARLGASVGLTTPLAPDSAEPLPTSVPTLASPATDALTRKPLAWAAIGPELRITGIRAMTPIKCTRQDEKIIVQNARCD